MNARHTMPNRNSERLANERAVPLWYLTKDGDRSCLALYERHYSCYEYADGRARTQFVGPGETIVLRTGDCDAMFVWRKYIDDTVPKQEGVECAVFRNEAPKRYQSSELIRQADAIADRVWPGERHYTKVDPQAVGSRNPGFCFVAAGWRRCGMTKGGLLLLEHLGTSVDQRATHEPKINWKGERVMDPERLKALEDVAEAAKALKPFMWEYGMAGESAFERACMELFDALSRLPVKSP
jgi:hypothetical protein